MFYEDDHYRRFLCLLEKGVATSGCSLWAYALMSNHYHLIVFGTPAQLAGCMQAVNHGFAVFFNEHHGVAGHTFDGPYHAHFQRTPYLLVRRVAYVFLNPVAAGITLRAEDYAWSSYRDFVGLPGAPLHVDPDPVLRLLHHDPQEARKEFAGMMCRLTPGRVESSEGVATAAAVAREQFEWLLDAARARQRTDDGEDSEERALRWGLQCGIPPRIMAGVLGNGTPAPVYWRLRQLRKKLEADPERYRRLPPP
ncbi:MAG: hypothetical protein HYY17_00770 [Planctomycetes bacterium]|nr:hypothetical protein [Planctomycetota bacterium]